MLIYAQRIMNSPWGVVMVHFHLALRSCHLVWQFKHSVTPMALTCWVYEEVKRTKKLSRGNCGTLHENNCFYWKDQISCNESNGPVLILLEISFLSRNTKFFKKRNHRHLRFIISYKCWTLLSLTCEGMSSWSSPHRVNRWSPTRINPDNWYWDIGEKSKPHRTDSASGNDEVDPLIWLVTRSRLSFVILPKVCLYTAKIHTFWPL